MISKIMIAGLAAAVIDLPLVAAAPRDVSSPSCKYIPGDPGWPSSRDWETLNQTVGGKLIAGKPLAQPCYSTTSKDTAQCDAIKVNWERQSPYFDDPVNFMTPYWLNDSCNPFFAGDGGTCELGNIASYAINVSDVSTIIAGIKFAQEKNIRLSVKNTGHDVLGRSSGKGSLALWTHNLKHIEFITYNTSNYTGPAVRLGAGVQVDELYAAASENGYQVPGGSCPTVGVAGGWTPGGGHGPLTSAYGLGSDNVLAFEVVTADGRHLNASATENFDLYWALAGGGPGNFAIVLSVTHKAYKDVPVAGAYWQFRNDANTTDDKYWAAIEAWIEYLPQLDPIPNLKTILTFNKEAATQDFATWPGATVSDMKRVMEPFYQKLESLNLTLYDEDITTFPTFNQHYLHYSSNTLWTNSFICGNRHIDRATVRDKTPQVAATLRKTVSNSDGLFSLLASNVTHLRVGNTASSNSVQPAWRDSLFSLTMTLPFASNVTTETLQQQQALMNTFQNEFKQLTPGGGSYINEATFDNPDWKADYFGEPYDRLALIKSKYDPNAIFWAEVAVNSDRFYLDADQRLCAAKGNQST